MVNDLLLRLVGGIMAVAPLGMAWLISRYREELIAKAGRWYSPIAGGTALLFPGLMVLGIMLAITGSNTDISTTP